jgi:hypothetical protein
MGFMRRSIRLPISKEEKVANKIIVMLSDLNLDLEALGFYLAKISPHLIYNRTLAVLEAMKYNKEEKQLDRGSYRD